MLSLAAVSCRRGGVDSDRPKDHVNFTVSMDQYSKATDAAFEAGDQVGIFALAPINAANVRGTVSGTTLTPDTDIMWVEGQTERTDFVAYMPYDATLATTTRNFTVQTDQTTYANYQASDLLASYVNVAAGSTVAFNLKHVLSKLIIMASCEDTEDAVKSIEIAPLAIDASADLKGAAVTAGTNKAAVKAGAAQAGNGGQGFVAILVPQTVQLELTVATNKGRVVEYTLSAPTALASGKAYTAEIVVKKEVVPVPASPVEFTISITDWENGGNLTFIDKNDVADNTGKWSVVGLGGDWDTDIWMEETSEGVWEVDITYAAGDKFKLRQDGLWSTETEVHAEAGQPGEATSPVPADGSEYGLWGADNTDITLPAAGEYHLKFIPDGYKFYVTLTEAAPVAVTVYAENATGWDALYLYIWKDEVGTVGAAWPGIAPASEKEVGGVTYKAFEYGEDIIGESLHLIFNDGAGTQLADYDITFTEGVAEYYLKVTAEGVVPVE